MCPDFCLMKWSIASLERFTTPNTFNSNICLSTDISMFSQRALWDLPALLTSTSIFPKCLTAWSKCFLWDCRSVTSITRTSTSVSFSWPRDRSKIDNFYFTNGFFKVTKLKSRIFFEIVMYDLVYIIYTLQ